MRTKTVHVTQFGNFAPTPSDRQGYITYHDHPRYSEASEEQLQKWLVSKVPEVRAAVRVERANRDGQRTTKENNKRRSSAHS